MVCGDESQFRTTITTLLTEIYIFHGTGERSRGCALFMTANKPETALYRAPTFSLLLVLMYRELYFSIYYIYIHVNGSNACILNNTLRINAHWSSGVQLHTYQPPKSISLDSSFNFPGFQSISLDYRVIPHMQHVQH